MLSKREPGWYWIQRHTGHNDEWLPALFGYYNEVDKIGIWVWIFGEVEPRSQVELVEIKAWGRRIEEFDG